MKPRRWTGDQLRLAVKKSTSIRQVLHLLGLKEAGGNYFQIAKYFKEYGLDVSHFKGKGWNKGLRGIGKPRLTLEQILIVSSNFQSYKLKKRLFLAELKNENPKIIIAITNRKIFTDIFICYYDFLLEFSSLLIPAPPVSD